MEYKNAPDTVIPTFTVWHKVTGDELVVDVRTFDAEVHSKTKPSKKEKDEKDKK